MRTPIYTSAFKKERKLMQKRGKDKVKLDVVIAFLMLEKPLPAVYREHPLHGNWIGMLECHIESDWLLIYKLDDISEEKTVTFERTGTHVDLFNW